KLYGGYWSKRLSVDSSGIQRIQPFVPMDRNGNPTSRFANHRNSGLYRCPTRATGGVLLLSLLSLRVASLYPHRLLLSPKKVDVWHIRTSGVLSHRLYRFIRPVVE